MKLKLAGSQMMNYTEVNEISVRPSLSVMQLLTQYSSDLERLTTAAEVEFIETTISRSGGIMVELLETTIFRQ